MLVKECMSKEVDLATPEMRLKAAAEKMRDGDIGILPVEENDRLVGMITDRDIAVRAVASEMDPKTATVGDIMSDKVLYCFDDQSTEEVARNMGDNQVRRLPVLNREKRLVGILSLCDLTGTESSSEHIHGALSKISRRKAS